MSGQNKFEHEWVTDGIWFSMQGEYYPDIAKNIEKEEAKYEMQGLNMEENEYVKGGHIYIQYFNKEDIEMLHRGVEA